MRSKIKYPTVRFVAERLSRISDDLQRDYYPNSKLSRADRFIIGSYIQELRSHVLTLLHYAPMISVGEENFPRTIGDYDSSDYVSF